MENCLKHRVLEAPGVDFLDVIEESLTVGVGAWSREALACTQGSVDCQAKTSIRDELVWYIFEGGPQPQNGSIQLEESKPRLRSTLSEKALEQFDIVELARGEFVLYTLLRRRNHEGQGQG